jgi:hypothetical protein
MRYTLPGGATLGSGDKRRVVCRPLVAVIERTRPTPLPRRLWCTIKRLTTEGLATVNRFTAAERLVRVKLLLGVLTALVGLVSAVLALFGWSRK